MAAFPTTRLRRLRANETIRAMLRETTVSLDDLIYPIFVEEELDDFAPVESMPGVHRIPERKLGAAIKEMSRAGIKAVMTFGVSHHKDDIGGDSWNETGLVARMIRRAKDAAPEMLIISDTCFCEYTSHGHCGVIHGQDVHNDHTIENLGAPVRGRGAGGCRHDRAVGDDGRPGGGDPRGAGRRGVQQRPDHGLLVKIRLGVLWSVSRGGGMRVERRSESVSDGPAERTRGDPRVADR